MLTGTDTQLTVAGPYPSVRRFMEGLTDEQRQAVWRIAGSRGVTPAVVMTWHNDLGMPLSQGDDFYKWLDLNWRKIKIYSPQFRPWASRFSVYAYEKRKANRANR